jgi:hypothetical protein
MFGPADLKFFIYTLSGTQVKETDQASFWCGSAPLPICSAGGFDGDPRIAYDPRSGRWITSGLWVFSSSPVATDVLAVSKSSDPTAGWYLYQFPACGGFDTWDSSDQPHLGFNRKWIVVTSACSASRNGVNGAGLAVFDKATLYGGKRLRLNTNWFEFVDPYSGGPYAGVGGGNGTRDNPVATYVPTIKSREYLTVSVITGSRASVVYSYLQGPIDAPKFHSAVETVTPRFSVSGNGTVDAPGCTACMASLANTWIHSSGVWDIREVPYVLSTMVTGDPRFTNATQIINIATNTETGAARAIRIAGGASGAGPMASEIAMPLASSHTALIAYDDSRPSFIPGVKAALWNVRANTISSTHTLKQGSFTPTNGDQNRWVDFIDALTPVPGPAFVLGATLASPSTNDPQRSTYWTTIAP